MANICCSSMTRNFRPSQVDTTVTEEALATAEDKPNENDSGSSDDEIPLSQMTRGQFITSKLP